LIVPQGILLGGGPIALPVARSLAAAGVRVCALGTATDPARHSRAVAEFVDLGSGEGVQERWLEWLRARQGDGGVLLPCNDDALELVARRRATLVGLGYRPLEANDDVVLALLDKHETYARARAIGVPSPRTALVGPETDLSEATAGIAYPLALKPRHSHLFARHFGIGTKVFVAHDVDELTAHAERMRALGIEMLVTEVIPGRDDDYHSYYTYVDERGSPVFDLTKHKLRQYPVGFGLCTYHLLDRSEETIEIGRRFAEGMGVRGVVCAEFKRDARDGTLKLIECNHRFTAACELVRHAGIDLALLAYNRAAGRPDPPLNSYRTGVTMWHPVEDARAVASLRRTGELTLRAWLQSLARPQHFPLFSWRDPKPSLVSISRFPMRVLRRPRR
jgi:predicted ATP-grasp superfamily ATP-dependent carboligase